MFTLNNQVMKFLYEFFLVPVLALGVFFNKNSFGGVNMKDVLIWALVWCYFIGNYFMFDTDVQLLNFVLQFILYLPILLGLGVVFNFVTDYVGILRFYGFMYFFCFVIMLYLYNTLEADALMSLTSTNKIGLANYFSIHFQYNLDNLGLIFVMLNIIVVGVCVYMILPLSRIETQIRLYLAVLLILLSLLNMVFLAADILTFFIAFESVLIPMILLIGIWGSPLRRQANNYLIFYTAVGAIPMLLAILYLWNQVGTVEYLTFYNLSSVHFTRNEQIWLWIAFFISFAIKTPMVPVHIWLPKAHVDAPTTGSVILAGLLLKIGLFGFLRLLITAFPMATDLYAPIIAALATVGVLYASFVTLRQIDMKRIIAYSSVAHMNMALVSLCSINSLGVTAAIYLMLSHGIVSSALFFLVGSLYNRFHQRTVIYYGGLMTFMPVFSLFLFVFSLANMAFPLTSGFIGEFFCLAGIMSTNAFLGVLNAGSMLLTTVYSMLFFGRVCLGNHNIQLWVSRFNQLNIPSNINNNIKNINLEENYNNTTYMTQSLFSTYDLCRYEFNILSLLLVLMVGFGIYPQPIFVCLNEYVVTNFFLM